MATRIRICAARDQPTNPNHVTLQYTLLHSNGQAARSHSHRTAALTVPVPHSFITNEISWYLEDYAQKQPFEGGRAADARDALREHARDLAFWLHTSGVVPDVAALHGALVLEVVEDGSMPERLLWEVLEHREAVPALAALDSVIVNRVFGSDEDDDRDDDAHASAEDLKEWPPKFNLLIVSSRLNFESDIPHRLVVDAVLEMRNEVANIMKGMEIGGEQLDFSKLFRVEVINPATFKAFQAHLESRGSGYFRLVHLDVHGIEDAGSVKLGFMRLEDIDGSLECVPDDRSAEEVAALLQRYDVKPVVLNACRSAKDFGTGTAIPRLLHEHGVEEVVAMSHNISSRGVLYFVSLLYFTMFCGCSLQFGVWYARRVMLRNSERLSHVGTELEIMDHIVPRYYRATRCAGGVSDFLDELQRQFPEFPTIDEKPHNLVVSSFGRDHDLLKLACLLLEGDRAVMVVGEPGIGKSLLLSNLMNWWEMIGCVEGAHLVQLSQEKSFSIEKLGGDLHRKLNLPGPYSDLEVLITALRNKKYLLVIDSLESLGVPETTTVRDQRRRIRDFVKGLQGGKTVVAIASRQQDPLLDKHTRPFHVGGLQTLPAVQLMRWLLKMSQTLALQAREKDSFAGKLVAATLAKLGLDPDSEEAKQIHEAIPWDEKVVQSQFATWETEEDAVYLEEIHKLVDGHPLALTQLTNYLILLGPSVTPKEYFHGLLQGNPMSIHPELSPDEFLAEQ
ncbi:uncharacterized protein EI97DRAFT_459973 [Westerdykella ornata]|uniref:AAA+ ATPase domain-containing protein n=1 Tax=Westerdykella ornata TaxID=318751 RepID=A0A6A6JEI1_WESOR|nr:uncharacterized protein EI97DRAFT_459973 [Westerdykella ornata]KAF2274697.1 hypothetical protein EI97DRAFT_459973 [Westerdykella ornata]